MKISPARRVRGRVKLPGDKSISHRAAIIAALATGTSRITNFSPSDDCRATLSCLRQLGVSVLTEGNTLQVAGGELRAANAPLDCRNSGSTIRMLAGVLAGQSFSSTLTGDPSLRSRPMQRIIEPLTNMGARVTSANQKPPLTIEGASPLIPIRYELPIASAQVKSCVLLAGLHAEGSTEVIERHKTRDHTERMLTWLGVSLLSKKDDQGPNVIGIDGLKGFQARDLSIPGDISSAAFLIAAAALCSGSDLEIIEVGTNPSRTGFLSVLQSFGLQVEIADERSECNEPRGIIHVRGRVDAAPAGENARLVHGRLTAELIDELPLLAVVGTQIPGGIEIRDAGELRYKESDRISSTVTNLRAMGAEVEEFGDGLRITGPVRLRGARIDSFGDHRIAMAFAVAALIAEGSSEIVGDECVGVSFPDFFRVLESVVER
ncbi:MAG: 3-phosphoshikimate 1-carboxyvinyltransferase [Pyrinomonadaceae bacterium]